MSRGAGDFTTSREERAAGSERPRGREADRVKDGGLPGAGGWGGEVVLMEMLEGWRAPPQVLREKSINTCRGENQGLEQVRQRHDPPHQVLAVHQHQTVNLRGGRVLA